MPRLRQNQTCMVELEPETPLRITNLIQADVLIYVDWLDETCHSHPISGERTLRPGATYERRMEDLEEREEVRVAVKVKLGGDGGLELVEVQP